MWRTNTFKLAFTGPTEHVVADEGVTTIRQTTNQMEIITAVKAAGTISNETTDAILALLRFKK